MSSGIACTTDESTESPCLRPSSLGTKEQYVDRNDYIRNSRHSYLPHVKYFCLLLVGTLHIN